VFCWALVDVEFKLIVFWALADIRVREEVPAQGVLGDKFGMDRISGQRTAWLARAITTLTRPDRIAGFDAHLCPCRT